MNIKIDISKSTVKGDVQALNRLNISSQTTIETRLDEVQVEGNVNALNDVAEIPDEQIDTIMSVLRGVITVMDKNNQEYQSLIAMLESDRRSVGKKIQVHLLTFTEGVLASIVANILMRG